MAQHVHFHDFLSSDKFVPKHKGKGPGGGQFTGGPGGGGGGTTTKPPGAKAQAEQRHLHKHVTKHPVTSPREQSWFHQQVGKGRTVTKGAAEKLAASMQRLSQFAAEQTKKSAGGSLAEQAFGSEHHDPLVQGLSDKSKLAKVGQFLGKNVPMFVAEMIAETGEIAIVGGSAVAKTLANYPISQRESYALEAGLSKLSLKAGFGVVKLLAAPATAGLSMLVPSAALEAAGHAAGHVAGHAAGHVASGFGEWLAHHVAEEATDHTMEETGLKGTGTGYRTGRSLFRRQQPHDHAFGDAAFFDALDPNNLTDEDIKRIWTQLGQHVVKNTMAVLQNADVKQLYQQYQQEKGKGDKASPMFGGLGGNRIGDEGTSEGARKGWQKRKAGGASLVKAETPAPPEPATKPRYYQGSAEYQQMRANRGKLEQPKPKKQQTAKQAPTTRQREERRIPEGPRLRSTSEKFVRQMVDPSRMSPEERKHEREMARPHPSTRRVGGTLRREPGARGLTRQGGREVTRTVNPANVGHRPVRQEISMGQRGREGPGQEARATAAASQRAELESLWKRHQAGGLSDKEKDRMNTLGRIHGIGGYVPSEIRTAKRLVKPTWKPKPKEE